MTVKPQLLRLVNDCNGCLPPDHKPQINSVIEGEFSLNDCADVHIGPKYEHNANIVINQNISVSSEKCLSKGSREGLENIPYFEVFSKKSNRCCLQIWQPMTVIAALSLTAIFTFFILTMFVIFINGSNEPPDNNTHDIGRPTSSTTQEDKKEYPIELKFVTRSGWEAAQSLGELDNNTLPVERVIFIHTVSAGTCNKFVACKQQVQNIQKYHMSFLYEDIGYNFVIGSDGYIYVGVGWNKIGAHTKGYNTGSLGVAFIGDFRWDVPNDLMLSSAKSLLDFGVKIQKLSQDYQIFGHCQILSDFPLSPGKNILTQIKTWAHWNSTNINRCTG